MTEFSDPWFKVHFRSEREGEFAALVKAAFMICWSDVKDVPEKDQLSVYVPIALSLDHLEKLATSRGPRKTEFRLPKRMRGKRERGELIEILVEKFGPIYARWSSDREDDPNKGTLTLYISPPRGFSAHEKLEALTILRAALERAKIDGKTIDRLLS